MNKKIQNFSRATCGEGIADQLALDLWPCANRICVAVGLAQINSLDYTGFRFTNKTKPLTQLAAVTVALALKC